jgi:hypothetical protein
VLFLPQLHTKAAAITAVEKLRNKSIAKQALYIWLIAHILCATAVSRLGWLSAVTEILMLIGCKNDA